MIVVTKIRRRWSWVTACGEFLFLEIGFVRWVVEEVGVVFLATLDDVVDGVAPVGAVEVVHSCAEEVVDFVLATEVAVGCG